MTPTEFVTDDMRNDVAGGNFEPIFATVFAWLDGITDWKTSGRVVKDFSDVQAPEQNPAMFLGQGNEDPGQLGNGSTVWKVHADVFLYTHKGGNPDAWAGQFLNPILAAIRAALKPANEDVYTLAGLVAACRIVGTVEVYEGVLGEQALAIVPLEIVVLQQ